MQSILHGYARNYPYQYIHVIEYNIFLKSTKKIPRPKNQSGGLDLFNHGLNVFAWTRGMRGKYER